MYQPLEQFIIPLIQIPFFFWLNKPLLIIGLLFLVISLLLRINLLIFLFKIISRMLHEMFNIVSFNFSFLTILYLSIFFYIFLLNICGLLPYSACWTSQFFANLLLSFTLIVGLTLYNLDKNGLLFFNLFLPSGVPSALTAPLFILEFCSYFIRILSLSIRLFSNMVAGHSLLHILFAMSNNVHSLLETILDSVLFLSIFTLVVIVIIIFFEVIVAFLQAYVFAVMFIIYANDLNLAH